MMSARCTAKPSRERSFDTHMPKLIMLKGLPGSGKTTYANAMVKKSLGRLKRVNKDELRAMLDGGKWSKDNERFVLDVRDWICAKALNDGLDVIVDDTNLNLLHEQHLRAMAGITGAEFEEVYLDVPLEECIARDAVRGAKSVGEGVITDMYKRYVKT